MSYLPQVTFEQILVYCPEDVFIQTPSFFCAKIINMADIILKTASSEDCVFVARCVCMALHYEPLAEELPGIAEICRREDVLYSYKNAIIAWMDDVPIGLCLAYDGNGYHETRLRTFAAFAALHPNEEDDMDLANAEDETCSGEFYIDSLAVLPEYRRMGIGRHLMKAQMKQGLGKGLHHQTLLVDPENPNAQRLYESLGFRYESDCYAFGQTYWKWGVTL